MQKRLFKKNGTYIIGWTLCCTYWIIMNENALRYMYCDFCEERNLLKETEKKSTLETENRKSVSSLKFFGQCNGGKDSLTTNTNCCESESYQLGWRLNLLIVRQQTFVRKHFICYAICWVCHSSVDGIIENNVLSRKDAGNFAL